MSALITRQGPETTQTVEDSNIPFHQTCSPADCYTLVGV